MPSPYGLLILLPAYIFGEMWIGVSLAVITHLVPPEVVSMTVAIYLFIVSNIGSSLNLLVPILSAATNLRVTMLLMFAGSYLLAAILYFITTVIYWCTNRHSHRGNVDDDEEIEDLLHEPDHMSSDEVVESEIDELI